MALQGLSSAFLVTALPRSSFPLERNHNKSFATQRSVQRIKTRATIINQDSGAALRRNANYPPSSWDYDFVKSLTSDYTEEKYARQLDELKDNVKRLIHAETADPLAKLELLDTVQRLGLNHRFQNDVKQAVDVIYNNINDAWLSDDLYTTALQFRMLREHGYTVSQDVFGRFKDDTGNFKANLCEDVKGLLSLYEASFYGFQGEDVIDEAKAFSTACLKNAVQQGKICPNMRAKVNHALDMPLHWKLIRVEARWYIDAYEKEQNINSNLLNFAKLDYNIIQSVYQKEVSKLASWWVETGLDKMSFARDRLVEHYFWCNGTVPDPEYKAFRDMGTKVICLLITIDDLYDIYGSLEELELFTDYVDRWDITEIDKLPKKLKTVLLAMFNTTNQIGYWTLQERDFNIIPYLSKQWTYMCKAFLQEAKWYYSGYKPTLVEYMENGAFSSAAPMVLFCAYFLTADKITVEALDYIDKLPSIMSCSSLILRLTNDLGTSSEELARGSSLKAVQCYMNDTGASEAESKKYVDSLVHEKWKILNEDLLGSHPFSEPFLTANPNLARTTQSFYQYGDGLGEPQNWMKDLLKSLLVEPFTLNH
ncbi:hypothetical protein ACET3Z_020107 [Daucus carota]